ncbi:MAG: hypothetical protein J4F36_09715 [Nitrosopumilaceae archaeon]|nr:hypothetical protein [Nitrosopumilaceae archaeon]
MLVPISYSYSEEQSEDNTQQPPAKPKGVPLKDWLGWIFVTIMTTAGGIIGFLIKRHFNKRDLVYEKRLDYENWLLKQFNPMAESYYVPLAKFAYDAHAAIGTAAVSQDQRAIKIAFQNTCVFLTKYMEFRYEKGANFVFHSRENEYIAIGKVQAILTGIPFDLLMLDKIALEVGKGTPKFVTEYDNEKFYDYFEKWITSKHCNKSRQLVLERLWELQTILDLSGEEIYQGKKLQQILNIQDPKKYIATKQKDSFYILSTSKKTTQKEESLFVFGRGFDNEKIKYDFYIGDKKMDVEVHTEGHVKLKIPSDIEDGTQDVFAKFKNQEGIEDETIGLVVHINSESS